MSNDIHTWKVKRGVTVIGQVLRFLTKIEQSKVFTKSLDGTVYIQTIGSGTNYAEVEIFCTITEKDLMNNAEADGAAITVTYKDKTYLGYIEETPDWETVYPGEYYSTTIKLIIESVEAA